jgi:hypothetical protein
MHAELEKMGADQKKQPTRWLGILATVTAKRTKLAK